MSFDNANAALAVVTAPRRDHTKAKRRISETRLFRRYGIAAIAILALLIWTLLIWIISGNISAAKTKKTLTAKYDAEYEVKMQAFKDELIELNTPTQDELFEKQLRKEPDGKYAVRIKKDGTQVHRSGLTIKEALDLIETAIYVRFESGVEQ